MRLILLLSILILPSSFVLTACGGDNTVHDPYADWNAKDFYAEASQSLTAGEFQTAISNLESLEARFPFSPYAQQAQLDIAYAYYKFEEPDSAIAAADRFLRLNPRDPNVDYAWYLKGLANFTRGAGFMDSWFPRDFAQHDTKTMRDALHDFSTLVRRHPDSKYSADAYKRLVYLKNKMAEHEMHVAEYYIKREAWLAVAKRAQYTIDHYQQAPASRRALEMLVLAYEKLDLPELLADAKKVMEANPVVEVQPVIYTDTQPKAEQFIPPMHILNH
jgi:outer membrane protein assembly factor BamD